MKNRFLLLLIVLGSFSFSCRESVDPDALRVYDGPVNSATNIFLIHSDSAIVRTEIRAAKQLEFLNGDQEFPEGIDIKFYTKNGELETTLVADRGYFIKNENLYRGEGDVQIKNLIKDQSLKSEEIFWDKAKKKIYTEKFVTIQDKGTVFSGNGLESDDSFSNYRLKSAKGKTELPGEGI
ncbi:LPS export ABC transporter periplasmic protein LptC [Algoriphagus aestuariicola]|jgi:LPS export ABC transporter protein LptC|uniref:LPS export ABC transporter periplasmic protein LptC n=1 Tax=Algoriphagus aestuariicola TaxID=1852016 RepID=A0ABS3BV92_9BACT|nr:LPS export ABC transporter periplasmic protein LptC [Algoriphagus aestuariicola]MBN7802260.1 LPS export ABC transporter periplasmic protein LptC [Algoriphagus aestuariicola]